MDAWTWHDDRQWARSRLLTTGSDSKQWMMEVRSHFNGAGSTRLGEIALVGKPDGELTLRIISMDGYGMLHTDNNDDMA